MSKQILFVQGAGATAHDVWDIKLVWSLERELGKQYDVRYPRMPNEADPSYSAWKAALLGEFNRLEDDATLVGHSIGATVLLHVLAEHPPKRKPRSVALVAAPFFGVGGWTSDDMALRADLAERLSADVPIFLYHGTEDEIVPAAHVELYANALPRAVVRRLPGRDHQLNNDLSEIAAGIRAMTSA